MTAEEKIQRGHEAKALLANPLLQHAFESLEGSFTALWQKPPKDSTQELREEAYRLYQTLQTLRGYLTKCIRDGKFELVTIEHDKSNGRAGAGSA